MRVTYPPLVLKPDNCSGAMMKTLWEKQLGQVRPASSVVRVACNATVMHRMHRWHFAHMLFRCFVVSRVISKASFAIRTGRRQIKIQTWADRMKTDEGTSRAGGGAQPLVVYIICTDAGRREELSPCPYDCVLHVSVNFHRHGVGRGQTARQGFSRDLILHL
jgi:hypothetical protein